MDRRHRRRGRAARGRGEGMVLGPELEAALTTGFGLFNLFAYVRNARTTGWELWYAAWARPGGPTLLSETVEARLTTMLDQDL